MILPRHLESPVRVARPQWYFSSAFPDELVFVPRLPPMLRHIPVREAIGFLEELVDAGARAIRERRQREGRRPALGAERLLEMKPWNYPEVKPPSPKRGRPSKRSRENPYEDFDLTEIDVQRGGRKVEVKLRMPPEYPVQTADSSTTLNPYRLRSLQSKSVQKRQKLKERFPREFPEQFNPPRFYASEVALMNRAYGSYNTAVKEHRRCRIAFRDGNRSVVFPAGTIKMRRVCGVICSTAIPAAQMPRPPTIRPTA
jgi:hypothetical protein